MILLSFLGAILAGAIVVVAIGYWVLTRQRIREWTCRHFGHKKWQPPSGVPCSTIRYCPRCGKIDCD